MDQPKIVKELRQIRNLLILIAMKSGATANEVGEITGIGYSNVGAFLPKSLKRKKGKKAR